MLMWSLFLYYTHTCLVIHNKDLICYTFTQLFPKYEAWTWDLWLHDKNAGSKNLETLCRQIISYNDRHKYWNNIVSESPNTILLSIKWGTDR
jgi:hypothetical protein